jgi:hypothetical protein
MAVDTVQYVLSGSWIRNMAMDAVGVSFLDIMLVRG